MPTELFDQAGQTLLEEGHEFGTVTGRPRRCGWFDADLVRFTSQLNGCTQLALTKLDVLDKLPSLKICTGYRTTGGQEVQGAAGLHHYWEGDAAWLERCEPSYIEMQGWQQPTKSIRDFAQLPPPAQAYVRKIEELVGVPVAMISVGPEREAIIHVPPGN